MDLYGIKLLFLLILSGTSAFSAVHFLGNFTFCNNNLVVDVLFKMIISQVVIYVIGKALKLFWHNNLMELLFVFTLSIIVYTIVFISTFSFLFLRGM